MVLSASRIKTYLHCSKIYYNTYVLGMRDINGGNDGARRGTITHLVLELLLKPRHQKYIYQILKSSASKVRPIQKLIEKHAKILGVNDKDNLDLIDSFIKVGLESDYFCDGYDLQPAEWHFTIDNESPRYKIGGFLDKHAFAKDGGPSRIDDYKTSKNKFSGKDKDFNIQALTYGLALWKLKGIKEVDVNFLFLKFKRQPWQKYSYNEDHFKGYEYFLGNLYSYLENFDYKKSKSNYGADKVETFRLCGGLPGDLKADGSPAWVCSYKQPFIYFELKNPDGKIVQTHMKREELEPKVKEGWELNERFYAGCERFHRGL